MAIYPVVTKVEGLAELEGKLKVLREEFGIKTGGVIIRGLRAGAKLIVKDAKRRVPIGMTLRTINSRRKKGQSRAERDAIKRQVRGGLIRRNIVEHAIPTSSRVAGGVPTVIVRVRNNGYRRIGGKMVFNRPNSSPGYWWLVEFGTSKMPARPFMRPSFEAQKVAAVLEMKRHMQDEIAKHFGKAFKRAV